MPSKTKRRVGGGKHWKDCDVNLLLDILYEHLPRGGNEWELVVEEFNKKTPAQRDVESCRRKYKSLKNVRKPTGDPDCPDNVKRAKRIQREIETRISASTLDDDDRYSDNEGFSGNSDAGDSDVGDNSDAGENSDIGDSDDAGDNDDALGSIMDGVGNSIQVPGDCIAVNLPDSPLVTTATPTAPTSTKKKRGKSNVLTKTGALKSKPRTDKHTTSGRLG